MMKLTVALCNFANMPKNDSSWAFFTSFCVVVLRRLLFNPQLREEKWKNKF
jgi:hypothetical protein